MTKNSLDVGTNSERFASYLSLSLGNSGFEIYCQLLFFDSHPDFNQALNGSISFFLFPWYTNYLGIIPVRCIKPKTTFTTSTLFQKLYWIYNNQIGAVSKTQSTALHKQFFPNRELYLSSSQVFSYFWNPASINKVRARTFHDSFIYVGMLLDKYVPTGR